MGMLAYNQVVPKRVIVFEEEPYVVLGSHAFSKQQRKAVNVVKMRNLKTGRFAEVTFHQQDTIEEAEIENKNVLYLYENRGVYVVCDPKNRAERFELSPDVVGDAIKFVPVNTELDAMVYEEEIIGVTIPIKMQLKVKESAPAVKGNTSSGATKDAILETGARVQVPLFINEGDIVSINTEEGIYSERVEKA